MTQEEIFGAALNHNPHRMAIEPEIASAFHDGFEKGASWRQEQFEIKRLSHCDNITKEEAEREMKFVTSFIKQNDRIPTFSDCIEITRKQMIDKACEWLKEQFPNTYEETNLIEEFTKAMKGD